MPQVSSLPAADGASPPPADPALAAGTAGQLVIRGTAVRAAGAAISALATIGASIVLLRYLGVVDLGRYVTVMSIITIVSGLTENGLTAVGQREYTIASTQAERRSVLARLLGIRLVLTPAAVAVAVLFSAVAGYDDEMVWGTLLAGIGVVLTNIALTFSVPTSVELRLATVTAIETVRQLVTAAGFVILAALGAEFLALFIVAIAAGASMAVLAFVTVGRRWRVLPDFAIGGWRPLIAMVIPVALSTVINVVYLRIVVVIASLIATGFEAGLFATSFRVIEGLFIFPLLMVGSAFPVLAHSGDGDSQRLGYATGRLFEVTLLVALAAVVFFLGSAESVLRLLGGEQYGAAASTLKIQSLALVGIFTSQVWISALIAVRAQRSLLIANGIALVTAVALAMSLIPRWGAEGAAVATVLGEFVLGLACLFLLLRGRSDLRPSLVVPLRLVFAAGSAFAVASVLDASGLLQGILGVGVYITLAFLLRAVPLEIIRALTTKRPASD